ncbi:hypothetical protein [Treponema bryantii]|uniref:hypothetical protein n=1 Tax=Treponema bryantii TaxID=163 RepID=UPI002B2F3AD8|nr:hypothetical protein TRBR_16490 [Treponema bryantii]
MALKQIENKQYQYLIERIILALIHDVRILQDEIKITPIKYNQNIQELLGLDITSNSLISNKLSELTNLLSTFDLNVSFPLPVTADANPNRVKFLYDDTDHGREDVGGSPPYNESLINKKIFLFNPFFDFANKCIYHKCIQTILHECCHISMHLFNDMCRVLDRENKRFAEIYHLSGFSDKQILLQPYNSYLDSDSDRLRLYTPQEGEGDSTRNESYLNDDKGHPKVKKSGNADNWTYFILCSIQLINPSDLFTQFSSLKWFLNGQ